MGRQIDTDDIIDSRGVAEIIGVSWSNAVGTYMTRYPDFPRPVINLGRGRCRLWLRSEVEAWARARRRPDPGRGQAASPR